MRRNNNEASSQQRKTLNLNDPLPETLSTWLAMAENKFTVLLEFQESKTLIAIPSDTPPENLVSVLEERVRRVIDKKYILSSRKRFC